MSEVKGISTITNRAGTGAVDFSNGVNISGLDSGLSGFKHTEGATEPTSPSNGDTWWDTENEVYQIYVNDTWTTYIGASSSAVWYGDRGITASGAISGGVTNTISYFDITTTGNSTDFGDLTLARYGSGAVSDGTYAVIAGGYQLNPNQRTNVIDYFTISSTGNASDFGDLTEARNRTSGVSDGTTGVFTGGQNNSSAYVATIDYVTIATTGNATDFGDLTYARMNGGSGSDGSRGVYAGGRGSVVINTIDYITIASVGNATDFGDLTGNRHEIAGVSDDTYAVFAGGDWSSVSNIIEYVTIQTTGNATDFGDLSVAREKLNGTGSSNNTRGVFVGGSSNGSDYLNSKDYITISTTGNATDFGDNTISVRDAAGTSGSAS